MTGGDGLGPVFNASSCVECHNQGGVGGGGPADNNVTVYGLAKPHPKGLPQSGVVHQNAISERVSGNAQAGPSVVAGATVAPLDGDDSNRAEVSITQRNTPAALR